MTYGTRLGNFFPTFLIRQNIFLKTFPIRRKLFHPVSHFKIWSKMKGVYVFSS